MPNENFHACRLTDPGTCERLRYVKEGIDINGKKADRILCLRDCNRTMCKDIKTQSVRFDKKRFTEEEARKWCGDHSGTFEPATKK